ncbi:MAG: hypothetical protein KTR16_12390 [Acidiferrobacterales bacterium]|nr:hypothetical protein [Acidiferrobacterales bacterium]
MRKTLMFVIGLTILLAGVVGYIIGSAPEPLPNPKRSNHSSGHPNSDPAQPQNQNSIITDTEKTESSQLANVESLLVTATTTPLPLSLRAGIFFEESAAETSAQEISDYGYPATVQQFITNDQKVLNLVILAPFKNEANLQLAKYELFKKHNIVTQRIITPVADNTPAASKQPVANK